ncbi:MAG: hypothetical protein NVS4B8_16330 [Herpetosiphon sp.]
MKGTGKVTMKLQPVADTTVASAPSLALPDRQLDAGQTGCGDLILLIFQTMKQLAPGQTLEVLAYDLAAAVDIPAWCRQTNNTLLATELNTRPQRFIIQRRSDGAPQPSTDQ